MHTQFEPESRREPYAFQPYRKAWILFTVVAVAIGSWGVLYLLAQFADDPPFCVEFPSKCIQGAREQARSAWEYIRD